MLDARFPSHKAHRFATVEDVSEKIFDTFVPHDAPETIPEIDRSRVKTRLLDFAFFRRSSSDEEGTKQASESQCDTCSKKPEQAPEFDEGQTVFGWLVIVDGPGRGKSFPVSKDVTCIGRGVEQDVSLDFGDEYISRTAHVTIHVDRERDLVAVRFEGKRNPAILDDKILSGTRLLKNKSRLTIGQTILRFVQIDGHAAFWSA